MTQFARVVLPIPLDREFTYLVPEWLSARIQPGMRVRVPFGPRFIVGYYVGSTDSTQIPVERLKPIQAVLDPAPILDGNMLKLARWIADTYMCSWGEAVDAAVPRGVRRRAAGRAVTFAQLALDAGKCLEILPQVEKKSDKQARVIRFLLEAPAEPAAFSEIERRIPGGPAAARALAKKNIVTVTSRTVHSDPFFDLHVDKSLPLEPTPEQAGALRAIERRCAAGQFAVMLLHGVTGSGKTEVYLQSIAKCVAAGRQAIVLVPEISLTPQAVARFRSRFEHVAVLHSYLTDSQRAGQWLAIGSGKVQVVIGARSAVFAPVRNLGLIVIDEEHENSFKQDNAPRYHAREVAIERARLENAVVILGGATPSLESYENAASGRYELLKLPNRIEGRSLPPVEIVDMATEILDRTGIPLISRKLQHLAEEALARKEQVIFLLNRRGFATYVRGAGGATWP
jgi:primosomal protein N' (replication factor Y)